MGTLQLHGNIVIAMVLMGVDTAIPQFHELLCDIDPKQAPTTSAQR